MPANKFDRFNRLPAVRMQLKSRHQPAPPCRIRTTFVMSPYSKCEHELVTFDRLRHVDLMQLALVMDERPFCGVFFAMQTM